MKPDSQTIRVTFGPIPAAAAAALWGVAGGEPNPPRLESRVPLIDIHESADGLILEADLPGVSEAGISVQLTDNVLSLHARLDLTAPEGAAVLHAEFHPLDFVRSFILSDEVDRARISAELKQGVLRLNLPRAERAATRRIEVKRAPGP